MERRLIVMRHAKSSWKSDAPSDHARPLNGRGQRDAPKVGARLRELGWVPERVLSSDAVRARQTFEGMAAELGGDVVLELDSSLYHGGTDELRAAVAHLHDSVRTALVLGHNPRWEDALAWLTGRSLAMKTAYAVLLVGSGDDWSSTVEEPGCWSVESIIRPREIDSMPSEGASIRSSIR